MKCKCREDCKTEMQILEPRRKRIGKDYIELVIRRKGLIFGFYETILISKKELIEELK